MTDTLDAVLAEVLGGIDADGKAVPRTRVVELMDRLTTLLDAIDGGSLTASTATRYRLEGALVALRALVADL